MKQQTCVERWIPRLIEEGMSEEQAVAVAHSKCERGNKSLIKVIRKEHDPLRTMLLISSNAYQDRENEIIREKALQRHVKQYKSRRDNVLLYWHGGEPIGVIMEADMYGPFLVEWAKELPNKVVNLARVGEPPLFGTVKQVWNMIEESPELDWRASIGFRYIKEDREDGVYEVIDKFETSVLPADFAANAITLSYIV